MAKSKPTRRPTTTKRAAPKPAARSASSPAKKSAPKATNSRGRATSGGPSLRIGHGWDLHRLEPIAPAGPGRPLVIGGIKLEEPGFDRGPVARSDGDVLLHAVTDALLGALGMPDIGQLFPDTDERHEGQDSRLFVTAAVERVTRAGYRIVNLDTTVVLQRPKIGPVKERIRMNLAKMLGVGADRVNIKGKTHERVDAVGESRAVEAHAVVIMERA